MEKIKISKGFKTRLAGTPDMDLIKLPDPDCVGLSVADIPYIRPKLLVEENERVKIGTPLFCDKRDKSVQYVSPAAGIVQKILFGERRRLQEVVIGLDGSEEVVQFDLVTPATLGNFSREDLSIRLKQGGVWPCFRQFPAKDTADNSHNPAMIIVSMDGNDIFSPHPGVVLENETTAFEFGLEVLGRFSDRIIVTVRESSLDRLGPVSSHVTHGVDDIYPAWDPGVVLYHLKKTLVENSAWCISAEHLVMVAKFLLTGSYPIEKIVTLTKTGGKHPHFLTRQGVPVKAITGDFPLESLITTGYFNGRIVDPDSHLGFFENTLNIINHQEEEELFGFIRPGKYKATVSKTFFSSFLNRFMEVDCTLHGETRACINCSYCENICPNDLMPSFIMKALHSDGIEEALELGLLDCCQCGLCSYTCPSKIELTKILSDGMDSHYKDKS